MVYDMCHKFADEELAPNAGRWDKQHAFPTDAVKQLVRYILCMYVWSLFVCLLLDSSEGMFIVILALARYS